MKAEEARKITFEHSERMQKIYAHIEKSAKTGRNQCGFNTTECTKDEMEVLKMNGFDAEINYAEEDGYPSVCVKW